MKKLILPLILLFSIFASSVKAQTFSTSPTISCSGPSCSTIFPSYTNFINQFNDKYINKFVRHSVASHALANANAFPYSNTVNLEKFLIAGQAVSGFTQKEKILVVDPIKTGEFDSYNLNGFSLNPSVSMGLNIGWTANMFSSIIFDRDRSNSSMIKFLDHFSFYYMWTGNAFETSSYNTKNNVTNEEAYNSVKFNSDGWMLRYRLSDKQTLPKLRFIDFMGSSIGMGFTRSNHFARLDLRPNQLFGIDIDNINVDDLIQVEHNGLVINRLAFNYNARVHTKYLDFRIGLKFFDMIDFYIGFGASKNKSRFDMTLEQETFYKDTNEQDNQLFARIQRSHTDTFIQKYYIAGVAIGGFNLNGMQTYARSITAKRTYSIAISYTISF